ncbi:ATP-dependent nuclease [Marinobacter sp. HN1S83]|uniref:ATP-dependent nuclease n=1 Tax=Marinobacter sp. HN1S83 TaxID=3382301 RepID=UPI00387AF977
MILEKIKIETFKKINFIEIGTASLNILVGSNGSGKSSVLQATHLAACLLRQADRIRAGSTSTVAVMDLDYLPTDDYMRLGHGENWGNKTNTPSSKITFTFRDENNTAFEAVCEARAARNAGISVTGQLPEEVRGQFRGQDTYFSGFIPGISGLPNSETKQSKRVVLKACSFGDSNVYLRNALNLLSEDDLRQLEAWLGRLMGEVQIRLKFREDRDLVIKAEVAVDGVSHPIELLGTGYLQLIQIFCYVLLFQPKILLIDEPDIHLHPNVQEKLASSLSEIAAERELSVVLSTHSPFILRGAPLSANVYWLENGALANDNREAAEIALGWGAFGKKVIIVSEDKNIALLKKIVSQWPELDKFVTYHPGQGYKNLMKKEQAIELYEALGRQYKILVHRDRDSLTDNEVERLVNDYESDGIKLWFPEQSDIEAYFCSADFIADLTGNELAISQAYIDEVIDRHGVPARDQFNSQRQAHNQELYAQGGSPQNDEVWLQFQVKPLQGYKGKYVFNQLKNVIPGNVFSETSIVSSDFRVDLANDLRDEIEQLIAIN